MIAYIFSTIFFSFTVDSTDFCISMLPIFSISFLYFFFSFTTPIFVVWSKSKTTYSFFHQQSYLLFRRQLLYKVVFKKNTLLTMLKQNITNIFSTYSFSLPFFTSVLFMFISSSLWVGGRAKRSCPGRSGQYP